MTPWSKSYELNKVRNKPLECGIHSGSGHRIFDAVTECRVLNVQTISIEQYFVSRGLSGILRQHVMRIIAPHLKRGTGLGLLFLVSLTVFAGSAGAVRPRLKFKRIGLEQGLPTLATEDVIRDDEGFLWICTSAGLCRFDGYRTQVFTLDTDAVSRSNSWFGAIRREGRTLALMNLNTWYTFDIHTLKFGYLDSASALHASLAERKKISTRGWGCERNAGLHDPSGRVFPLPERSGEIFKVEILDSNEIWIAAERGVFIFYRDTELFDVYMHDANDPTSLGYGVPHHVYRDHEGITWVCTYGGGVSMVDKTSSPFTAVPTLSKTGETDGGFVFGLAEDSLGRIWSASAVAGLQCYDPKTGGRFVIHRKTSPIAIPQDELRTVMFDKDGTLWSGFPHLFRIDFQRKKCVVYSVPAEDVITGTSDGMLWCHSIKDPGLRVFDPRKEKVVETFRWDPFDTSKLSCDSYRFVFQDSRSQVWVGTSNGLHLYHPATKTFSRFFCNPDAINDHRRSFHGPFYTQAVVEDDSSRLWIGTRGGGLICLDINTYKSRIYAAESGLTDLFVYAMARDDAGNLWLGTSTGLMYFSLAEKRVIQRFTEADGLLSNEFNTWSSVNLRDGRIAMGGLRGYHIFDPRQLIRTDLPPAVRISGINVNGAVFPTAAAPWLLGSLELQHQHKVIAIDFSSPEYGRREKVVYQYAVQSGGVQWIGAPLDRRILLTALPPGEYTLLLRASYDGISWNQPTQLRIIIAAPFWLRWWFLLACAGLVTTIVVILTRTISTLKYRTRIARLEKDSALMKQREQISLDMHDEVGSSITKILTISRLPLNIDEGIAKERMHRIADLAVSMVDSVQQIVWALNPANDALDATVATLRAYAKETLDDARVELTFVGDDDVDGRILPLASRRNIYLFVKEAINNVIRHSSATSCTLEVRVHGDELIIRIADNGRGLGSAHAGGNGVMSMRRRIESIGGTFVLDSPHGSGTTVSARIPFTEQ